MYYEKNAEKREYLQLRNPETMPHFHGVVECIIMESGEVEATVDGEKAVVKRGEGIFVDSFTVHSYKCAKSSRAYILLCERKILEDAFEKLGGIPEKFFKFGDFGFLDFLYRNYDNAKGVSKSVVLRGSAIALIGKISENVDFAERKNSRGGDIICKILAYAEENFSSELSVTELARRFGYSSDYLSRLFGEYLSENWNAYVGRLRAVKAKEKLSDDPSRNVLEIAFECGFGSSNTFYRAYKKEFGEPPKKSVFDIKSISKR